MPTILQSKVTVSPHTVVICIAVTREINHIHFGFLSACGKRCACPNTHKCTETENRRHNKRYGSLDFRLYHLSFLLKMKERTDYLSASDTVFYFLF